MTKWLLAALVLAAPAAAEWGETIEVRHLNEVCVSYRAKLADGRLIVQATLSEGWHTFTMDNDLRAEEALAGKMSLGVDAPTRIEALQGLEIEGPWKQSPPENFSNPEIRWYSWGYADPALFVAPAAASGARQAAVAIRGQACSETTCKNIDVVVPVAKAAEAASAALPELIPVRTP